MARRKQQPATFAWFGFVLLGLCIYFTWHHLQASGTLDNDSRMSTGEIASRRNSGVKRNSARSSFAAVVTAVADGDSLVVRKKHHQAHELPQEIRVRLEGVDAPEFGQPFHRRAKQFVSDKLLGKTVMVLPHELDRYGRLVARVFLLPRDFTRELADISNLDSESLRQVDDLSWQLLNNGLAWHFERYNDDPALAKAAVHARARQLGLWQDPHAIAPWIWREQSR